MSAGRFVDVGEAAARLRGGEFIVLCERESADTTGSLMVAADFADADAVNFMVREGRGLVCLALTDRRCRELGLAQMERGRRERDEQLPFTVTIEAAVGVTTGISAADRARTIAVAIDRASGPGDLVVPGHVPPLRAAPDGLLARPFRTEAAIDLVTEAGLTPAAAICQILAEDGSSARLPELRECAERHGLRLLSVPRLIAHRLRAVSTECDSSAPLVTGWGLASGRSSEAAGSAKS